MYTSVHTYVYIYMLIHSYICTYLQKLDDGGIDVDAPAFLFFYGLFVFCCHLLLAVSAITLLQYIHTYVHTYRHIYNTK